VLSRRALSAIIVLIVVSPVFGVWLADIVGYHEPLDVAAEALGLEDVTESLNWTPFLDYTVPGLPASVGYAVAGFMGVAIILLVGFGLSRLLKGGRASCRSP